MLTTLLTSVLILAATCAQAELSRCVDASGHSTIQDTPCAQDTEEAFALSPLRQHPSLDDSTQPSRRFSSAVTPIDPQATSGDALCTFFGQVAVDTISFRDRGLPLTTMLTILTKGSKRYELSPAVRRVFRTIVTDIYAHPYWTAQEARRHTEVLCIKGTEGTATR